jgi:diguanylate cyclase (GGDEF)-like protein
MIKTSQVLIALLLNRVAALEKQIKYDRLTNVLSQSALIDRWQKKDSVTVIAIDVMGLKIVNESQGHDKGDLLLQKIAFDLKQCFRLTDCVYRRGGDEFVIILPHCDWSDADKVESKVRSLPYDLYIGTVSGCQQLSVLIQAAFSQVECQKKVKRPCSK